MRPPRTSTRRRTLRGALAAAISALLIVTGLSVAPAMADTDGGVSFTTNQPATGTITGGTTYTARMVYEGDKVGGENFDIVMPEGVSLDSLSFPDNLDVAGVVKIDARTFRVTFVERPTMQQGSLRFDYVVTDPAQSSTGNDLSWRVDGQTTASRVTILNSRDSVSTVTADSQSKSANAGSLDQSIVFASNPRAVTVVSKDTAAANYTVTVTSKDARTVSLVDTIDARLDVLASSITATLDYWDADGLNKKTTTLSATDTAAGLSGTFDMPANSRLTVSYKAKLTEAAATALQTEFQELLATKGEYDAAVYRATFTNDAVINGATSSAPVTIQRTQNGATAPTGPNSGDVFKKTNSVSAAQPIEVDASNNLVTPLDLTYTLTANLALFNTYDAQFQPNRNVVISDNRNGKSSIAWASTDPNFVVDAAGVALQRADDGLTAAEFAGDAWIGTYRIVNGTLEINAGTTGQAGNALPFTNVAYTVKARIVSVADEWGTDNPNWNIYAAKLWAVENRATFTFRTTGTAPAASTSVSVYTPKDTSAGLEDRNAFSKAAVSTEATAGADGVAWVPFRFVIGWNNTYEITKSTIVDAVDHDTFNVSADNLAAIGATATGSFGGKTLNADALDLAMVDGNLEISVNAAWAAANYVSGRGGFDLTLSLPTHVLEGKETLDFTNKASLYGSDRTDTPWVSSATASATSYGGELEINKHLYGADGTFGKNLRVELAPDGSIVNDTFIYRIQLRAHGDFPGNTIKEITDVLPEGMKFVGFVADADLAAGTTTGANTFNMGGGITAAYSDAGGQDVLKLNGTINTSTPLNLNFKVRLESWSENVSVVNQVSGSKATITPSNGYPLVIQKVDSTRPDKLISDTTARFRVDRLLQDGSYELITADAYLVDGNVVVAGADGAPTTIVVPETGTYRVSEMKAPAGYEAVVLTADRTSSNKTATIVVTEDATTPATITNTPSTAPVVKSYAIGDYVWYDDDADGVQDEDEDPVSGVTVRLLDADGNPVLDGGVPVTTTTDASGRYVFDELPAGTYRVQFVLPEDIAADYVFTDETAGDDPTVDSDANPANGRSGLITLDDDNAYLDATRADVTATEGIDPTWDAGIVRKPVPLTYAIGDLTWIDTNKDGIQDPRERVLAGMIVRLLDADGAVLDETTTDENGLYLFDELAAGQYRVEFEIPESLRTTYAFTASDTPATSSGIAVGANEDSDAAVTTDAFIGRTGLITLDATNTQLTTSYDAQTVLATAGIDPTWDAGVIVKKVSVGDFVWIDENQDGLQDEGEPGIPGVVLELRDPNGDPVLDEFDQPRTTTTGPNGEYVFDNLPALDEGQTYTVVIDPTRSENVTALDGLTPTRDDQPGETNSSTWEATSVPTLTTDGAHDPTLDFGFTRIPVVIPPTYAIGDYVWIDEDADGVQDAAELPLAGVRVELLQDGTVIAVTTTDAAGRYLFDELPAGTYRIRFVLTEEQQEIYAFTTATVGGTTTARDSDADVTTGLTGEIVLGAGNAALTKDYAPSTVRATEGVDPTWDAGVILRSPAPGEGPEEPPVDEETGSNIVTPSPTPTTPGETPMPGATGTPSVPGTDASAQPTSSAAALPATGQNVPLLPLVLALIALLAGFALVVRRTLVRR